MEHGWMDLGHAYVDKDNCITSRCLHEVWSWALPPEDTLRKNIYLIICDTEVHIPIVQISAICAPPKHM